MELFVLIFIGFVLLGVILKSLTQYRGPGAKSSSDRFVNDTLWMHTYQDTQTDNNPGEDGQCHCDLGCDCDTGGDFGMSDGGFNDCGGSCGGDCGGS